MPPVHAWKAIIRWKVLLRCLFREESSLQNYDYTCDGRHDTVYSSTEEKIVRSDISIAVDFVAYSTCSPKGSSADQTPPADRRCRQAMALANSAVSGRTSAWLYFQLQNF